MSKNTGSTSPISPFWLLGSFCVVLILLRYFKQNTDGTNLDDVMMASAAQDSTWIERFVTTSDVGRRAYYVHLPKSYDGKKSYPVVLNFHGGMSRADQQREISRMDEAADKEGFIVVYPQGTGRTRLLTFNAGACCGYAANTKIDDVGYTRQILDDLEKTYSVDRRRIYATGYSNGAMLCYRLACELSDRIAAIAPVSGTMGVEGPKPNRPVPVLHIHGLQDRNVPFAGGKGENQFQPNPHRSVDSTLQWWRKVNRCEKEPKTTDNVDYERVSFGSEDGGASIELYKIKEGGHTWPGGSEFGSHLNLGKVVKTVSANKIIWDFFNLHPMEVSQSKTDGK